MSLEAFSTEKDCINEQGCAMRYAIFRLSIMGQPGVLEFSEDAGTACWQRGRCVSQFLMQMQEVGQTAGGADGVDAAD